MTAAGPSFLKFAESSSRSSAKLNLKNSLYFFLLDDNIIHRKRNAGSGIIFRRRNHPVSIAVYMRRAEVIFIFHQPDHTGKLMKIF